MKNKKRNNIRYSKTIIIISLFLFALMILRLIQLGLSTTIDGVNLKQLASKRTTKTETITAKRGNIYSNDGDILAQNVASYKIIAYLDEKRTTDENNPQHVVDKEKTATELAPILGMEKETILKYLNKENVYQTEFGSKGKNLTELTKQKIELLNLPGIDFIESFKRYYPKGDFASYTIGYAKNNTDSETSKEEIVGEMGIEKQYDNLLRGEDGYITYQKDLRGYQIANTNVWQKDAVQGKDVYLTLESNVQFFIEQALDNADADYDFEWFTITILDAKTGAILGTATSPSFDPNTRNITNYLDLLLAAPYEPGSTMKTFTYMAAIENGVYNGNDTYKSGVYYTTDGTEIGDWNRAGWGMLTYDKGYAMSSNVAIINLIKNNMDSMMLRQYFKKLGFGKKTGISLPNESAGKIDFKYETEIYNAGFGQGITTTPIQNVQAMTPLTNDGMLLKPYIVSKIVDPTTGEVILENTRKTTERVASTATVQKMLQLMDDCVNGEGNTGSGYKISSGELIGKTGTAQIANENGGGYLNGKEDIISSFAGIYPKSDPQYIIYASVKRPTNGSQKPISNAIKEIVNNLSKYYGTEEASSNKITINEYTLDSYVNKKIANITTTLNALGIKYSIIGDGDKVIKQYPEKNDIITNKDTLYLITNTNNLTVPNVVGLSSKVASSLLKELGIKVNLEGVGYVTSQSIQEGTPIIDGLEINLALSPKYQT
ncbi:MAG: penicillin-binding transpeptidase domain-containing protein [bacterium]|nr:penicillin-binding transpeptidase domain-containing protein [bacterium]